MSTPKTRGLLVTFAGYPQVPSNFMPDNGLAGLAAVIKELGHDVTIVDYNTPSVMRRLYPDPIKQALRDFREQLTNGIPFHELDLTTLAAIEEELERHQQQEYLRLASELCDKVSIERIDWVGFKLWNGDGFLAAKSMASFIKQRFPKLLVIAGGPQVDFYVEHLAANAPCFDFVAFAEGEPLIPHLIDFVQGKGRIADIPNIIYRDTVGLRKNQLKRVTDLNALPLPLFDEETYPALASGEKVRVSVYEESRGCPIGCNFCVHPVKAGKKLRKKSINTVITELKELRDRYGFSAYKLAGSYTPVSYLEKICQEVITHDIQIDFVTYGHISDSKTADFELLRRAGCHALFFGLESGSELILQRAINERNKNHTATESEQVLRRAKQAGIFVITSVIYPNTFETEETRAATMDLLRRVRPDSVPVHWPILVPNTKWFEKLEDFGFSVTSREAHLENLLTYKARLMFPPQFWKKMLYTIGGRDYDTYSTENRQFVTELEQDGILTLVSDDTVLMANLSGISPREYRDLNRSCFLFGNVDPIEDYIAKINSRLDHRTRQSATPARGE